jgi:hypothetical protein
VLTGRVNLGKNMGEVVLKGYTFDVADIDGIWTRNPPSKPRRRLPTPHLLRRTLLGSGQGV